jgi:hypothetical protein
MELKHSMGTPSLPGGKMPLIREQQHEKLSKIVLSKKRTFGIDKMT